MTKQTNYLVTVTDVNQMLPPITTNPTNSNRGVIKNQVGQTAGSVGVVNNWQVDTTAIPFTNYTSNRLPRFQDLVYKIYYCGDSPVINSYDGLDFYLYFNVTVDSTVTTQVYFNWTSYDRPNRFDVYDSVGLRYTTGWVGQATYPGPWGSSLNTATSGSQLLTWLSTSGRYVSVAAGPADPSAPLSDTNTWNLTCLTPTTTSTTSTTSTTTTLPPYQSYDLYYPCGSTTPATQRAAYTGNQSPGEIILGSNNLCYTIVGPTIAGPPQITVISEHSTCQDCDASRATTTTTTTCNPTPNWQDTGIYNCYGTCNLYYEQQNINPCSSTFGQTRQGPLYQTNSTSCGGCCGQSTAANWVNSGGQFCSGCTLYQPQIDNNTCSSTYNQTRNVSLGTSNDCGSWDTSYYCTGCAYYSKQTNSCTGDVRNVTLISSNSTSCGGCCGQSTAANWVNTGSYSCYSTCNKYNVEQDNNSCSSTYGQTQQGSLVESNSSFCYQAGNNCCGQSPTENWVNNGSVYCSACNEFQPQINNNVCSSTYGATRNVDLGVNSNCGSWPSTTYCVGYDLYSKETNSCTGAVRNVTLVETNSYFCGYRDCATWNIYAYNSDEYVYVNYQNCADFPDFASFYSGGGGFVGSLCVRNGTTPYISSGNGSASNTFVMCS